MNELQVTVMQKPGEIRWNFEELKHALTEQLQVYKEIVYTDDNIGDAKKDAAALRKLSKSVNDRKIEIKKKCLEPYAAIEEQAKELIALINEPIEVITERVNDYENQRKAEKQELIMSEMRKAFADLPDDIRTKLIEKTFDPKWLNATCTGRTYAEVIKKAHDDTVDALRLIGNVDEDFAEQVMEEYMKDLCLTAAMTKAQDLQAVKERMLERERLRKEQEQVLREQIAQSVQSGNPTIFESNPTNPTPDDGKRPYPMINDTEGDDTILVGKDPVEETAEAEFHGWTIMFRGSDEQLDKVLGYIMFIGADYELR